MNWMISVISSVCGNSFCIASIAWRGVVFRAVNQAKCFFDQFHAFGRKILAFQSDQISPANFRGITIGDHKRRNILHNFGTAAGDRESADPTELMYGSEPAHHGMISDLNVPAQRAVIRKNDAVADGAIMTDMTVSEEVSAITNARFALARGAPMRCYEFAKCVFVADFQIGRFAAIF